MDTISARDAKELTKESIEEIKKIEIDQVFSQIKGAIDSGEFEVSLANNLHEETITLLESLGYVIYYEGCITISWDIEEK